MGEPAGIGGEIALKAWLSRSGGVPVERDGGVGRKRGGEVFDTYRTHHQLIGISNINRLREWLALSTGSNCLPFCLP